MIRSYGEGDKDLGKPLVAINKAILAKQLRQKPGCRGYAASMNGKQVEGLKSFPKTIREPAMLDTPVIPTLGSLRQKDDETKASTHY